MEFSDLIKIVDGYRQTRILFSAIELGIFENMNGKPTNASEISSECKTNTGYTETLLNSLVSMKLLDKSGNTYENTLIAGKYFIKGSDSYIGDIILFSGNSWDSWEKLSSSIKNGKPQSEPYIEKQYDKEWEYFIKGMHNFALSRGDAEKTTQLIDFSNYSNLLDIACGPGTYSFEIGKKFANINVNLFDLPNTIEITKKVGQGYLFSDRIKYISGDYKKDEFPSTYDCALLFNIIHQENSESNLKLIKKIYNNLDEGGILIIKDHILNEDKTLPEDGSIFAVQMRLINGGRCYSEAEVSAWMSDVGFKEISKIGPEAPMTSAFMTGIK